MCPFPDPRPGELIVRTSAQMLEDTFARLRPILAPAEREGYDTSRVYLLLDELLSNVYRHGYHEADDQPIGVRVRLHDGILEVAVRDQAPTFDVARHAATCEAPPPERGQRGGMGLFIVYSMCDTFVHQVPRDGGNVVFASMRLPRRGSVDAPARAVPNAKE